MVYLKEIHVGLGAVEHITATSIDIALFGGDED